MSSDTLRGGLIGCGFFAQNHLHAWRDVAGAELVAVCDLDAAKAGAAARTFGVPNHYADAVEMFSGEELDFVDIVTTMASHRSLVELAASKGVPAICQKPFAPTMKDAEAMVEACRSTGVALMVHENFRWQRPLMALHDAIAGGGIGQPFFGRISFRSSHDVYANQPYLAKEERFIILDLAIHLLDVARYLFGEARRLTCHAATIKEGIRGEDSATMLLGHESGATSIVDCSYAAVRDPDPFPETLIEVDGDEGSVRLDAGYRLTISGRGRTERRFVEPMLLSWAEKPWHGVQESVRNIQQHWVECLRSGQEPATSGADNLKTFALAEAAYASAAGGGRTVDL